MRASDLGTPPAVPERGGPVVALARVDAGHFNRWPSARRISGRTAHSVPKTTMATIAEVTREPRLAEDDVGDQDDRADHREREKAEPGDRQAVRGLKRDAPCRPGGSGACARPRRDQQRSRDRRRAEDSEEEVALELARGREALANGRSAGRRRGPDPGQRDAQLVEQLDQLAIDALARIRLPSAALLRCRAMR